MQKSRRFIFVSIFFLVFILAGSAIVLYALGYRLNQEDPVPVAPTGGLSVRVSQEVRVFLDGTSFGVSPLYRSGVDTGTHTVKFQKRGFQDWRKELQFDEYVVTEIEDTLLFPNTLSTSTLFDQDPKDIENVYASPRQTSFLFTQRSSEDEEDKRTLIMYNPREERKLSLTSKGIPAAPITNVTWGQTSNQFLVTINPPDQDKQTFLVTDVSQETPTIKNITSLFPYKRSEAPLSYLTLTNNIVTLQQGGHMFEINVLQDSTSDPIVSDVQLLEATSSRIVYVDQAKNQLFAFSRGDPQDRTQLASNLPANLNEIFISPNDDVYLRANTTEIYTMQKKASNEKATLTKLDLPAKDLKFSGAGKKVIFATDKQIAVRYAREIDNYADREKGETSILYTAQDSTKLTDVQWLPVAEAHILFKENGAYSVVELDNRGKNGASTFSLLEADDIVPRVDGRKLKIFALKNATLEQGSFSIQRDGLFQL
ncbi:MAG: hypothetical protein BRC24_00130 [Parcubacteria group bacterium SW_4_46_8]|nr:MAG: hypothetical protein BRC24_00130 [Parcubacteria group bacterium SW_4_46_8]